MKLLSLLLFTAFELSLFINCASSRCKPLNGTLFGSCFTAGFRASKFSNNTEGEIFHLFKNMRGEFNSCSSALSTVMSCAVHLPHCPNTSLPCKTECWNFVRRCKREKSEGLVVLFRRLCELLSPSEPCLSSSNASKEYKESDDEFNCTRMAVNHCTSTGYEFTSVSRAYQEMVQSADVFKSINSTLRKVICMELVPPCNNSNSRTLYVPCKSTCEAAFNESNSQFLESFKSYDYCSTFPDENPQSGKEYCALKTWPSAGYWPSDLWKRLTDPNGIQPSASSPFGQKVTQVGEQKATNTLTTPSTDTRSQNSNTSGNNTNSSETLLSTSSSKISSNLVATTISLRTSQTSSITTSSSEIIISSVTATMSSEMSGRPTTTVSSLEITSTSLSNSNGMIVLPVTTTNSLRTSSVPVTTISSFGTSGTPVTTANSLATSTTPETTTNSNVTSGAPVTTTSSFGNSTTPITTKNSSRTSGVPVTTTNVTGTNNTSVTKTSSYGTGRLPVTTVTLSVMSGTPVTTINSPGMSGLPETTATFPEIKPSTTVTKPSGENSSVTTTSKPTENKGSPEIKAATGKKLSGGAISGVVIGSLIVLIAFIVGVLYFRRYHQKRVQYRHSLMVDMDEL